MAVTYIAPAATHIFGVFYAKGADVDVSAWNDKAITEALARGWITPKGGVTAESDPVAGPEITAETSARTSADTAEASTRATADTTETTRAQAAEALAQEFVIHGSTASTARPAGAGLVHWVGSVAPNNKATNDEWTDTANKIVKRWNGASWDIFGSGAYAPVYVVPAPSGDTTGVTDTAAIQARIDQAAAAGGGIVYVPANPTTSSWYWISQLQLKEYVTLCGAGIASRIKQIAGATTAQHMIVWADGTNNPHANIYDLLLDGNAANQTQTNIDVIHAARSDSTPFRPGPDAITALARVQRVHIDNYVQYGIYFSGSWHECRVKDNFVLYGGIEGIHFEGSDSEIADNTVGFVANRGINVYGPTNWLYGNKTWYVGFTVNTGGTGGTVNVDNTTYGDGLYIGVNATNTLVSSHYSQDCARHGVALDGVTGVQASGLLVAGVVKSGFWVNGATACTVVGKGTGTGGTGSIAIQTLTFAGTNTRCYVRVTDSVGFAASNVSGSIDTKGNDVQVNMTDSGTETIVYAATITPNPFLGRFKFVNALTGNITVNVPTVNCHAGQRLQFHFVQDGTGGRTITFAAGYKINWTPVTTANLRNVIEFIYNGSGAWIQVSGVVGVAA